MTQTIDISTFQDKLINCKGGQFMGFVTATDTRMNKTNGLKGPERKKNPFYGNVLSVRRMIAQPCVDYDKTVENRREKEGKEREEWNKGSSWHEPVFARNGKLTPFCKHKATGQFYIRVLMHDKGHTTYIATATIYDGNRTYNPGDIIAPNLIHEFMPKKKHYANQGLDNPVTLITLKLDSILYASMNKQTFEIKPSKLEFDTNNIAERGIEFMNLHINNMQLNA